MLPTFIYVVLTRWNRHTHQMFFFLAGGVDPTASGEKTDQEGLWLQSRPVYLLQWSQVAKHVVYGKLAGPAPVSFGFVLCREPPLGLEGQRNTVQGLFPVSGRHHLRLVDGLWRFLDLFWAWPFGCKKKGKWVLIHRISVWELTLLAFQDWARE